MEMPFSICEFQVLNGASKKIGAADSSFDRFSLSKENSLLVRLVFLFLILFW